MQATFLVKKFILRHDGIIPGARGHKKITIPKGTLVFCITHGHRIFCTAYLDEQSALDCAEGLAKSLDPETKHHIPLDVLVTWNFSFNVPKRISRPKVKP